MICQETFQIFERIDCFDLPVLQMPLEEKTVLEHVDKLIDENMEKSDFSIDEICLEVGISRSQLFRLTKQQTDLSISRYIRRHRLLKGKELLDTTELRIVEITYKVGLDSPQSFSKFFMEEFGITPSEYRKNKANEDKEALSSPDIPASNLTDLQPIQKNKTNRFSFKKPQLLGFAFTAFTVLTVGFYFWQPTRTVTSATSPESELSIAVLPFKNTDMPEASLLAEGLTEQIHTSLTTFENLKVISKNSTQLFSNTGKTIPQIASELHVGYILDGAITQSGEYMSVNVELVKATEDKVVWAKNYQGKAKEVIAFINKSAEEITNELTQELTQKLAPPPNQVPTDNVEAYQEYLKGKQLMLTRTQEKLEAAIGRFDRAIALDPNFAEAYAYKASAFHILGNSAFIENQLSIRMAENNALTAIRIDAKNGTAYAVLANVYRQQNKWEQAVTTYKIALKYSPNDAQINYWYSITLRAIGEFDKAIQYSTKAIALDPLYPTLLFGHIGNCSYAGKFKLAQKSIQEGKALFSNYYMYYYVMGFYYINLGNYQAALKEFKTADSMNPSMKPIESYLAFCQAKLGQKAAVKTYLASLTPTPDNYDGFAIAYAGLNDKEQCFHYLQLSAAQGHLPEYFKVSPFFTFLHNDRRFNELLQPFGLLDFKIPI